MTGGACEAKGGGLRKINRLDHVGNDRVDEGSRFRVQKSEFRVHVLLVLHTLLGDAGPTMTSRQVARTTPLLATC